MVVVAPERPIEIENDPIPEEPQPKPVDLPSRPVKRTLIVHHGPNRHQRRTQAKIARTQNYRNERHELKIEMNRKYRQRRKLSFKRNPGNQFRGMAA